MNDTTIPFQKMFCKLCNGTLFTIEMKPGETQIRCAYCRGVYIQHHEHGKASIEGKVSDDKS